MPRDHHCHVPHHTEVSIGANFLAKIRILIKRMFCFQNGNEKKGMNLKRWRNSIYLAGRISEVSQRTDDNRLFWDIKRLWIDYQPDQLV